MGIAGFLARHPRERGDPRTLLSAASLVAAGFELSSSAAVAPAPITAGFVAVAVAVAIAVAVDVPAPV